MSGDINVTVEGGAGLSAYELWLVQGNTGSLQDFLSTAGGNLSSQVQAADTARDGAVAAQHDSETARDAAAASAQHAHDTVAAIGITDTGWPRGAHAWWRLRITGFNGDYGASIAEIAFRATPGSSTQTTGGAAFASSGDPTQSFDGDPSTYWTGNSNPLTNGYHFTNAVSVNEVAVTAPTNGYHDLVFTTATVQWSDDGQAWTDAWTITNSANSWSAGETRAFTDPLYGKGSQRALLSGPYDDVVRGVKNGQLVPVPASSGGSGKSAGTLALLAAIARDGSFPTLPPVAVDTPTVTMGAANGASAISGSTFYQSSKKGVLQPSFSQRFGVPVGITGATDDYFGTWATAKGAYRGASNGDGRDWASGHSAFEFVHTGSDLEINILTNGGGAGCRLLVNDRVAWAGDIATDSSTRLIRVTFPTAGKRLISWETRNMVFLGVRIAPGDTLSAVPARPWISWQGDSFVDGAGGTAYANNTLGAIAGRALGCNVNVVAVGGTGILSPGNAPNVAATDPHRIADFTMAGSGIVPAMGVISGSNNDGAQSPGSLQSAITAGSAVLIEAWLAAVPGSPLVLTGPWDVAGQAASPLPLSTYYIRDGMQQAAYQYRAHGVHFLDQLVPELMVGVPTDANSQSHLYTFDDNVHPSRAGSEMRGLWHAAQIERLIATAFA